MLRSESIMMLHQMRKEGKSIRRISRETGLSRNTVKSYLKAQGVPERKARKKKGSKVWNVLLKAKSTFPTRTSAQ